MDILHVSSELSPYCKVGGLADVIAALSKHLKLLGHDVTVALPRYRAFEDSGLLLARRLTPVEFEMGEDTRDATLYDGRLASGVRLLLVDIPGMFDRDGIYGDAEGDFSDNAKRFAAFCHALTAYICQRKQDGQGFDVVHCHDWPTALIPFLLRESCPGQKTLLNVHNLAHQGVFPKELVPELGLRWQDFNIDGFEFFGQVGFLKAGLGAAHSLATVSEQYAKDILTAEYGAGLEGLLQSRKRALTGIVNGVDSSVWNPATDVALPARYDVEDLSNKAVCKHQLLDELELDMDDEEPLLVFVGRLVEQKGADLLVEALPKLVDAGFGVAVAGEGNPAICKGLKAAEGKLDGRMRYVGRASEGMVHRLFGAADFALVPSRFEPCGLVQLYAHRYGALPIAREIGGLKDTIVDCDAELRSGSGFLFEEATAESLVFACNRAMSAWRKPTFEPLVRRVMRLDRGWERPARRYQQLYRKLAG